MTVAGRVLARATITHDGCWTWNGGPAGNGYGQVSCKGRKYITHRVVYEAMIGPIPEGLTIDHLCRNRLCVNPAHLEAVTMRENLLRGDSPAARAARRDSCPKGHAYTKENTYVTKAGVRQCRHCHADNERRYRAKRRRERT